jgi:hypothetical protein
MRATAEFFNQSLILNVSGNQGNPTRVIIGGADGTLITIGPDGQIIVTPPEGPGDPELKTAFRAIYHSLSTVVGILQPCVLLAEELGNIGRQMETASGPELKLLEQRYNQVSEKYAAEGCGSPPQRL